MGDRVVMISFEQAKKKGYTSPFIVWKKDGSIDFGFAAAMFDDTLGNELKETKL